MQKQSPKREGKPIKGKYNRVKRKRKKREGKPIKGKYNRIKRKWKPNKKKKEKEGKRENLIKFFL